MKKTLALLVGTLCCAIIMAQPTVSFNSGQKTFPSHWNYSILKGNGKKLEALTPKSLRDAIAADDSVTKDSIKILIARNKYDLDSIKGLATISNDSFKIKAIQIQNDLLAAIDSLERRHAIYRNGLGMNKFRNHDWFLPAYFATQSIRFYTEQDENYRKFFANTILNYNSTSEKIGLFNEIYNDYFGPVRFGVGFMITSTSNDTAAALKTKNDVVQKIASGGGNFNLSASFPFLKFTEEDQIVKIKSSIYLKSGIDVPKTGNSTTDYGLFNDFGVNTSFYADGFFKNIFLFGTYKLSYVTGNKSFETRLTSNNFSMHQISLGIAVKDAFRIRFDQYLGNEFIKTNFPASVSFEILTSSFK